MWVEAVLFLSLVVILKWYQDHRAKGNIPGYMGIPLLGVLPFLKGHNAETFRRWSAKLGPVFSIFIGTRRFIVLNTYKDMKECFVKCGKYTSGRPIFMKLFVGAIGRDGVLFRDDNREMKKLCVKLFRSFVAKVEENLHEELTFLNVELKNRTGTTFDPKMLLLKVTANTISKGVVGSREDYDDPVIVRHTELVINLLNNTKDLSRMAAMNLCYWLRHIPPYRKVNQRINKWMFEIYDLYGSFLEKRKTIISNKRELLDNPECFLDEVIQFQNTGGCITDHEIRCLLLDMFAAGSDTTAVTLYWCILYLALNPIYQETLFYEVRQSESSISYEHNKMETPNLCSFIDEILRHRTVAPSGSAHMITETFRHNGMTFYKGDTMISNIWAMCRDPQYFDQPDEFKPDRFIINGKYIKSNFVPSFGMGQRTCLGTKIADVELYLVLSNILKNYKIREDEAYPLPSFKDGRSGLVYYPNRYKIKIFAR